MFEILVYVVSVIDLLRFSVCMSFLIMKIVNQLFFMRLPCLKCTFNTHYPSAAEKSNMWRIRCYSPLPSTRELLEITFVFFKTKMIRSKSIRHLLFFRRQFRVGILPLPLEAKT